MRYVALILVLATLPLFHAWLRASPHRRAWGFAALGLFLFLGEAFRSNAFLLAWPTWPGSVRGIEVRPVDTMAIALILTRARASRKTLPFWFPIGFFGLIQLFSMTVSDVPLAAFFACWQYVRVVLVFYCVATECGNPELRRGLLAGFALGGLLQAGYVIQEKLSGVIQATGSFGHQNELGLMVELAIFPLIASQLAGDRRKIIVAGIAAFLLVVAGGGSRGAAGFVAGGMAGLMLLSLIRGSTPAKLRVLGIGVVLLAVATPLSLMTLNSRFRGSSFITEEKTRAALKDAARNMADDHPFGIGANQFVVYSNKLGYSVRAGVAASHATLSSPVHNAYLLARAETGYLGELAFIMLLTIPAVSGLRYAFKGARNTLGEIALGSSVALCVNAIHSNWEFSSNVYDVQAMLFVNFGIIAACVNFVPYRRKPTPPVPRAEQDFAGRSIVPLA